MYEAWLEAEDLKEHLDFRTKQQTIVEYTWHVMEAIAPHIAEQYDQHVLDFQLKSRILNGSVP